MEVKKVLLSLTEGMIITPLKDSVDLTQNSHSSQYIVVKLDGWKLEEGHSLWIGFERELRSGMKYTVNHIIMVYHPVEDFYEIPIPEDLLVTEPGEWNFSISNRWDFSENAEGNVRYKSLNSTNYTLVVKNSIVDASGDYISDADLVSMVQQVQIYLKEAKDAVQEWLEDAHNQMQGYLNQAKDLIKETECLENADTGDVVYELRTETDTTFTDMAISKLRLIIPENAAHGFYAGVNFTVAAGTPTELKFTNRTTFPLKLMSRGAALEDYDLTAKKSVVLIIVCDGVNLYCNLVEV